MQERSQQSNLTLESVFHTVLKLKTYLIISISIVLGLLSLYTSEKLKNQYPFWSSFWSQVSTALMVGVVYSGVSETLFRKDFVKIQQETLNRLISLRKLAESAESIGLTDLRFDEPFNVSQYILNSQKLFILFNEGDRWIGEYRSDLEERFRDLKCETIIFILNPNSALIPIHAKKVDRPDAEVKDKINSTIRMIKQIKEENKSSINVKIYGHNYYNPCSILLTESEAIINPYFPGKNTTRHKAPVFIFKDLQKVCYYKRLKTALEKLKNDDNLLFDGMV